MRNEMEDARSRPPLEAVVWWSLATGCTLALIVAAVLEPDARGYGTHSQLGLPPCGFSALTGSPCPGCGLTTAFAHAIRGNWGRAADANALGVVLFAVVCASIPLAVTAALRGWSVDAVIERYAIGRWALAVATCALVLWVVRLVAAI
jgi:hypothetical protein